MYALVVHTGGAGLGDLGLLLLRMTVGLLVIGHGVQKSLGWFGGDGLATTAAIFDRVGYAPGRPMVVLASATEILGALLLMLGAFTTFAGATLLAVMLVACSVHWQFGLWSAQHGFELPLTFAVIAGSLALVGPGRLSVDHLIGIDLSTRLTLAVLLVTVLGASALMVRRALVLRSRTSVQIKSTP